MLALIMAGGLGTRMNLGEKPLVTVCGRPMISYVHEAFVDAGLEVLAVVTPKVPMTKNWCRAHGIEFFQAKGIGYVEDLSECALEIDEDMPMFTCVADLPGITSRIIEDVRERWADSGMNACSVWVPKALFMENSIKCQYSESVDGIEACPCGLNIFDGSSPSAPQNELKILLNEPALTFNVNTPEELKAAEEFFGNKK